MQVSIHLDTRGTCQKCGVKPLNKWDKSSDFPVINQNFSGSKNSYVYAATTSGSRQSLQHFPFDTVVKLNTVDESVSTWSVGNRRFIGEPIFVPKGTEEGEGYLLVVEVSELQKKRMFTFSSLIQLILSSRLCPHSNHTIFNTKSTLSEKT